MKRQNSAATSTQATESTAVPNGDTSKHTEPDVSPRHGKSEPPHGQRSRHHSSNNNNTHIDLSLDLDTSNNNFGSTTTISPNQPITDAVLDRFIEIQSQTDVYERQGIFEGLKLAEEEFEQLEKSKRQAEINHKVLEEQTKKEKQDFDNISQPTVQNYFKDKQAHNNAITKEQEEYLQSLNLLEIASNELKAITKQYQQSKEKLDKYKRENRKAIDLYNEQMNILCKI